MSILKLRAACKDYLWGGTSLADKYGKAEKGKKIAETWELSCYPDSPSTIENGEFAGKPLSDYIEYKGKAVLGDNCVKFDTFPVLIKLIDAADDLSIQVHPDNEYAKAHESQYGKTEMWYILEAEEGAKIYYGFNREISKEELKNRIADNTVTEILNEIPVRSGDTFFIEAGTVHSICRGILTVEIQQSSDVTYRIYDYDRVDKDGRRRQLHIDRAVEAAKLSPVNRWWDFGSHLCKCEYFTADKFKIDGIREYFVDDSSFVHFLFIGGQGRISDKDTTLEYRAGDSVFAEAGSGKLKIKGDGEVVITYVPE